MTHDSNRSLSRLSLIVATCLTGVLTISLWASSSLAWGRRGHAIICQTAAGIAAQTPKGEFLKAHSFDLGYYCNVPDFVWKSPATYGVEWTNHFMDLEIFDRAFKKSELTAPYEMERLAFNAAFPEIKDEAGRSFWRIRELEDLLAATSQSLKGDLETPARHKLQGDWLTTSGAIGHYVGDLSQPLHVTENYDGQLTEQKGIHAFFEDQVVDELFHRGNANLEADVAAKVEKQWEAFKKTSSTRSTLSLLESLATDAGKALPELLKIDKKTGRKDVKKAASAYRQMIVDHMALGSMTLAELWRRHLGWNFDSKKFYLFVAEPKFIAPPNQLSATTSPPAPTPTPTPSSTPSN